MKRVFSSNGFNPDVSFKIINNKKCIIVKYKGYLKAEDTERAVERTIKFLNENPNEKIVLVWNCLDISDYEATSRKILQKAAADYIDSLAIVYAIVTSPIVIAATEIISFFSPTKIKTVSSYEELLSKI